METNNLPKSLQKVCQTPNRTLAELYENGDVSTQCSIVEQLGTNTLNLVFAYGGGLKRYNVRPGKIYGRPSGNERYKILQLSGDLVFYKDINSGRVSRMDVDELLATWSRNGIEEITFLDDIYNFVRKNLGPLLGPTLVGALLAWLTQKLR